MSYPDHNARSKSRRLLKYGSTLLAVCGLVAISLATFLPGATSSSTGSLPARQSASQLMNASLAYQPLTPPGQTSKPTQTQLTKANTFTGDVRTLPYVKPEKQELPERDEPVPAPIELGAPTLSPGETVALSSSDIQPSRPGVNSAPSAINAKLAPVTPANLSGSGPDILLATLQQSGLLANTPSAAGPLAPAPAPLITFDGLDYATWGAGHPPDTNGDVGPLYYIQTVNTSIGIYNKATGVRVAAFTFNTFMSQGAFGNLCDTNNYGDPVVLYDSFEDRWIITDFAFQLDGFGNVVNPPGSFECFAVSRSGDPVAGGWNFYSINTTGGLGDYPKLGVWTDGIYMSVNMFGYASGASFQTARAYVLNKAQMYAGVANPQVVTFDIPGGDFTVIPSNARLQTGTPPIGTPNYFVSTWQFVNAVSIYKFHVDWTSIANSTFTGPFTQLTGSSWPNAAVPNATTPGNALDVLQIRAMVQNQYSNISGAESLWVPHTVRRANTAGFAAPRWYQLNVTGGTVAANTVQAATWDPDGANVMFRFMPSLAVDRQGDMAIGYTTANTTTNPGLKYAGRLYTDTLSTLSQSEQTLYQGTGTQTGNCGASTCTRWGDYSAMTLDPDGCTFWYTNEYYAVNGLNNLTRIGSFAYPSCTVIASNGALTGTVIDAGTSNPLSGATVMLGSRQATTNGSGVYQFSNLPAGVYPNATASYPGYTTGSAGPLTVAEGLTTTQNFALNASATVGCFIDTTQADFQTGVSTNCDLTSSPGNVTLINTPTLDQQNTAGTTTGTGFNATSWGGQTFISAVSGPVVKVDVQLFCNGCTGTTPNLTASIRATSGGLPTGADLATATLIGFSSGTGTWYSVNFGAPATLTAGTQYALLVRPVANPSLGGYFWIRSSPSTYANGQRVTTGDSGVTWATDSTRDFNFKIYVQAGYTPNGNLISSVKDANPAAGYTPNWGTLAWNATTPTSTTLQFQVAASNNVNGPFNFVGPDNTASTYFTNGGSLSQFDGLRYLKYKAYLGTTDTTATPTLADVTLCYTNVTDITWAGNVDTDWFTAANWTPTLVPAVSTNVIIPTAPVGNRWPILTGTSTINDLTVHSGALLTITQSGLLYVNGTLSNNGALAQIKNVPASTTIEFLRITNAAGTVDKYHGVDLTPGGTPMGATTVQVKGNQSACTTVLADPIIHRCFQIDPTTQTAATVRFWFIEAERNAQPANTLQLWHWGPWTLAGSNYTYSESGAACVSGGGLACWFQATGVSTYSPFALGSGLAPNAVRLTSLEARSDTWLPVTLLGALLALGFGLSAVLVKRRRA